MGLDWNPFGKPRPGQEAEHDALLGQLSGPETWMQPSPLAHAPLPPDADRQALLEHLFTLQVSPYETLAAPRIGRDPEAEAWIREQYARAPQKPPTIEAWVASFQGYYATALVPDHDGLPVYSNAPLGGPERWSFRAQFFNDCRDVLGEDLHDRAWLNHSPAQLADYGGRLSAAARHYAVQHGTERVLGVRWPEEIAEVDPTAPISQAHIVDSAARWATWWSSRGHGMNADY